MTSLGKSTMSLTHKVPPQAFVFVFDMSHCQMLGKVEYGLPAKF